MGGLVSQKQRKLVKHSAYLADDVVPAGLMRAALLVGEVPNSD